MKPSSTFRLLLRQIVAILLLMGVCFAQVLAQSQSARTVTGSVTLGANNQPIAGANILIKGTQFGTVTDQRGNYSITVNGTNRGTGVLLYRAQNPGDSGR